MLEFVGSPFLAAVAALSAGSNDSVGDAVLPALEPEPDDGRAVLASDGSSGADARFWAVLSRDPAVMSGSRYTGL